MKLLLLCLDNDSGVLSLLNALDVCVCVFFFVFFFFFFGVAVAEMFFFGVTNRGNRLWFGLCTQRDIDRQIIFNVYDFLLKSDKRWQA